MGGTSQHPTKDRSKVQPQDKSDSKLNVTAKQIADAMKQVESGGDYKKKGRAGEKGAYQYLPKTWEKISSDYQKATGLPENVSLEMTPENQDKVTQWKVQDLLNKGFNAREIALIWNTSLGGKEQPLIRKGKGYDSEKHAEKVVKQLETLK